jgi:hypothetical protein
VAFRGPPRGAGRDRRVRSAGGVASLDRTSHVVARAAALDAIAHRHPELGGEDDPVAAPAKHVAEQALALPRAAVAVGGIEERDADIERGVDDRPRPGLIDATAEVVAAEAYNAYVERPELAHAHAATVSMRPRFRDEALELGPERLAFTFSAD